MSQLWDCHSSEHNQGSEKNGPFTVRYTIYDVFTGQRTQRMNYRDLPARDH